MMGAVDYLYCGYCMYPRFEAGRRREVGGRSVTRKKASHLSSNIEGTKISIGDLERTVGSDIL
jgi:hypothetical protein